MTQKKPTSFNLQKSKIIVIGAGHLGSLILKEWIRKKVLPTKNLCVHVRSQLTLQALKKSFPKLKVSCDEAGQRIPVGDVYVIAVKPQQWTTLRDTLKPQIKKNSLVLSIMAGIPPSRLQDELGCAALVAMTNTSLQVGEALTTLYASSQCTPAQVNSATQAFIPFGLVRPLDEKDFAAATALAGSHPAFAIWILNEIGKIVSAKLPNEDGLAWTLNVFRGANKLIKKKKDISEIIKQIATPGGCTAEGLSALDELAISGKLLEVFNRCQKKAEGLGK